jgi:hypothetical protein
VRPEIRRIVAVEAHRRRTGRCPARIHSLGTGETFDIKPADNGFVDLASGWSVHVTDGQITVPAAPAMIDLKLTGDVFFDGYDQTNHERFSGRAGGGASVTLYDRDQTDYYQYAIAAEGDAS